MTEGQKRPTIALIGFGEAGAAFAEGWRGDGVETEIRAFDIKTQSNDAKIARDKWQAYDRWQVTGFADLPAALAEAPVIFSLVTADQAETAAADAAPLLDEGAVFFDCNSCSPGAKRQSAARMEARGVRYVDTAVMSPVHPKLHKAPVLVSGPHAADGLAVLQQLNMSPKLVEGDVGRASSIKMIRSIMMKGLEALVLECVLSGRKAGVDDEVLSSLDVTYPGFDWKGKAAYMMERALTHGKRRASEMREVAKTVEELGFPPRMADATVFWEQFAADLELDTSAMPIDDYRFLADTILERKPSS